MGMFDYVKSEIALPDGFSGELQSKDFGCDMTDIVIRANGRLEIERFEYETTPKEERPYPDADDDSIMALCGALKRVNRRWEDLNYHGDFCFYGYENVGEQTFVPAYEGATWGHRDGEKRWHEYVARFTDGNLVSIRDITQGTSGFAQDPKGLDPQGAGPVAAGHAPEPL